MLQRTHRTARRILAVCVTAVALTVALLLSAASATAQVLPPESDNSDAGHGPAIVANQDGVSSFTLVLIACAVVVVCAALGFGFRRISTRSASRYSSASGAR